MRLTAVTLVAVLASGLATLPAGAEQSKDQQQQMDRQQPAQEGQGQPRPGQAQSQDPNVLASAFSARVTGEVSSVDQQSGKLTMNTPDGRT